LFFCHLCIFSNFHTIFTLVTQTWRKGGSL
jgi:hypothetical protein